MTYLENEASLKAYTVLRFHRAGEGRMINTGVQREANVSKDYRTNAQRRPARYTCSGITSCISQVTAGRFGLEV